MRLQRFESIGSEFSCCLLPVDKEKEVNLFSAKLQRLGQTNRSTQILVENMDS